MTLDYMAASHILRFALCAVPAWAAEAPLPQFEKDILPILEAKCVKCHAGATPQASLDVRSRATLVKGGASGAALISGEPDRSLLFFRVRSGQMPPGGPKLDDAEIALIRRWIEVGAPAANPDAKPAAAGSIREQDRRHWAFQPPQRPAVPRVRALDRVSTPIDAFLLDALDKKGLAMNPETIMGSESSRQSTAGRQRSPKRTGTTNGASKPSRAPAVTPIRASCLSLRSKRASIASGSVRLRLASSEK